jgi:nitrogenase molybdenum-iron protein alpha/beta subunit
MKVKQHQIPNIANGMRRVKEAAKSAKVILNNTESREGSFYSLKYTHIYDYILKHMLSKPPKFYFGCDIGKINCDVSVPGTYSKLWQEIRNKKCPGT